MSRVNGKSPRRAAGAKERRVDRLAEAAKRGWVVWLVILATVGGFAYVVVDHWPKTPPHPDLAVCRAIDLDRGQIASLDRTGRTYFLEMRRRFVDRLAEAQPGEALASALQESIEASDLAIALTSGRTSEPEEVYSALWEGLQSGALVSEACEAIGYRLQGYKSHETADGSITDSDARLYCESALDFLQTAADSKIGDQHLVDVWRVLITRSLKGLPPDVYMATVQLHMMMLASTAGEGYPPAQQGAYAIRDYCVGLGMEGWPK